MRAMPCKTLFKIWMKQKTFWKFQTEYQANKQDGWRDEMMMKYDKNFSVWNWMNEHCGNNPVTPKVSMVQHNQLVISRIRDKQCKYFWPTTKNYSQEKQILHDLPGSSFHATVSASRSSGPEQGHPGSNCMPARLVMRWADSKPPTTAQEDAVIKCTQILVISKYVHTR